MVDASNVGGGGCGSLHWRREQFREVLKEDEAREVSEKDGASEQNSLPSAANSAFALYFSVRFHLEKPARYP